MEVALEFTPSVFLGFAGPWRSSKRYSDLKTQLSSRIHDCLSPVEVLLKYAQDLLVQYKRQNLQPSRSLARDFTAARQHNTYRQKSRLPPPTPTQLSSANSIRRAPG